MQQYQTVDAFMHGEPNKARHSGFEALRHLDPPRPLVIGGYGINGPGELSLDEAARAMVKRNVSTDRIVRGVRPVAKWAKRPSDGRPAGSFSYEFMFASVEEQDALRPFRDDPANRLH